MNKDLIKKIILEHQERIPKLDVFPRHVEIPTDTCCIVTGPRRAGKTFLIYRRIQVLLNTGTDVHRILYINFEDERLLEMNTEGLDTILESYRELFDETPLIFLDEIQIIPSWQKFARRLADSGYLTVITGSNAHMLSSQMASTLGGRYLVKEIGTLSFAEYLRFQEITPDKNALLSGQRFEIQRRFEEYFYMGGFPELPGVQNKKEYLSTIFQKIFLGDIIMRHKIRNAHALRLMVKKLAESTTDEVSFNRIRNIIRSTGIQVGTATLIEYLGYFEEAFLIRSLPNYMAKITERETKKKYYFHDHGLLSLFLAEPGSALLETVVYNHLRNEHKDDLFYLRTNREVDFFIPGQAAVQVAWSLTDQKTRTREFNALKETAEAQKIETLQVVTWSEEEQVTDIATTIEVIPVWKWLLS
jgi:predicted AAA+ superfamily ATPase